jgi:hypothetical protein
MKSVTGRYQETGAEDFQTNSGTTWRLAEADS